MQEARRIDEAFKVDEEEGDAGGGGGGAGGGGAYDPAALSAAQSVRIGGGAPSCWLYQCSRCCPK